MTDSAATKVGFRLARVAVCFSIVTFSFSLTSIFAQDDESAPPPRSYVTKEERAKFDGEPEFKTRTKLVVETMKQRLDEAEKLFAADDFDGVFREFGHFRGLLDYALGFLARQDANQNKTLDNYKRLEITLRASAPRIESLKRELPSRYEEYIRDLLIYIRDARTKASESMFSDTVIPTTK